MYALHIVCMVSQSCKLNVFINTNCMNTFCLRGHGNLFLKYDHDMVQNVHTFALLKHNFKTVCLLYIPS